MHEFETAFCTLLQSLSATKKPAIIVGDFNRNLLTTCHSPQVQKQLDLYGFQQHVKNPTHVSGSLLAYGYTNRDVTIWQSGTYYSDHDILWVALHL